MTSSIQNHSAAQASLLEHRSSPAPPLLRDTYNPSISKTLSPPKSPLFMATYNDPTAPAGRCTERLGSPQQFWFPDMGVERLPFSWSSFTLNSIPVQFPLSSVLVRIPGVVSNRNTFRTSSEIGGDLLESRLSGAEAKQVSPEPGRHLDLLFPSLPGSPPDCGSSFPQLSFPATAACCQSNHMFGVKHALSRGQ